MSDQTGNEHKQGDLAQEILDRIVSDADFRQQLLDNPAETLAKAGYTGGNDVSGYLMRGLAMEAPHVQRVEGVDPITTAINCTPPPPTTTAINCGGGGGGGSTGAIPKKKPTNFSPRE